MDHSVDVFIIGGGINGTAIAADAAGRGLSVILCEKNDLASATSSASTKLIHGGLRYLETYEFNLVRKSLREQEILLQRAPHLITPLEFVLPYEKHLRPIWLIRLGLFIYDHLAKRKQLPLSQKISLKQNPRGDALASSFQQGFSYYDCFTDDARLVILNALSAQEQGAEILTRSEFISAEHEQDHWKIILKKTKTGEIFYKFAKVLINVAGPWVKEVQKNIPASIPSFNINLVKGSHIVVPKIFAGDFAYILQNIDQRIIFAIPYQDDFTLIGTTDVIFSGNPQSISITEDEKIYLCNSINRYFNKQISEKDILWSYSGVRCLQASSAKNPSSATREYKIIMAMENHPPTITLIGGKLTSHRIVAEEIVDKLSPFFPQMRPAWTATKPLPGGDIPNQDFNAFFMQFKNEYPWLPETVAYRYAKSYGTRVYLMLKNATGLQDLGHDFMGGLFQKEIDYLIQYEWAETVEDILWRRTKLGLKKEITYGRDPLSNASSGNPGT